MAVTGRPTTERPTAVVDLDVTGMTCAACASRIERKLNRLDGVEAAVNYATERANVRFDSSVVSSDDLIAAVGPRGTGHTSPIGWRHRPTAPPRSASA